MPSSSRIETTAARERLATPDGRSKMTLEIKVAQKVLRAARQREASAFQTVESHMTILEMVMNNVVAAQARLESSRRAVREAEELLRAAEAGRGTGSVDLELERRQSPPSHDEATTALEEPSRPAGLSRPDRPREDADIKASNDVELGPSDEIATGPWTEEEHRLFLGALPLYGNNWSKISARIKGRTSPEVRLHAHEHFENVARQEANAAGDSATADLKPNARPSDEIVTGRWTAEEHRLFLEALPLYGTNWSKISARIKGRAPNQVRMHAQWHFENVARRETNAAGAMATADPKPNAGLEIREGAGEAPCASAKGRTRGEGTKKRRRKHGGNAAVECPPLQAQAYARPAIAGLKLGPQAKAILQEVASAVLHPDGNVDPGMLRYAATAGGVSERVVMNFVGAAKQRLREMKKAGSERIALLHMTAD